MQDNDQIRARLREKRRVLDELTQRDAADDLHTQIVRSGLLDDVDKIALYLANDGEIDPSVTLNHTLSLGISCFLPAIDSSEKSTLVFCRYRENDTLQPNQYQIPEPIDRDETIDVSQLNLIFVPLVGFDRQGNRLGMGGGYYDRAFSDLKRSGQKDRHGPLLIGLAHSFQEVERLDTRLWDVPLDGFVTEREFIQVK